jgi:hypothetical protein
MSMSNTSTNVHLQPFYYTSPDDIPTTIRTQVCWLGGSVSTKIITMCIDNVTFFLNYDQAEEIVKALAFDFTSLSTTTDTNV